MFGVEIDTQGVFYALAKLGLLLLPQAQTGPVPKRMAPGERMMPDKIQLSILRVRHFDWSKTSIAVPAIKVLEIIGIHFSS